MNTFSFFNKTQATIILFLALFFNNYLTKAQTDIDSTLVQVETSDGNKFYGIITYEDDQLIRLETRQFGEITIQKSNIAQRLSINQGSARFHTERPDHLQSVKCFILGNAIGLKKGEAFYQNSWVLFNNFTYGFTDFFSLGVGIVPLFLFAGAPTPLAITPKLSVPLIRDRLTLAAGTTIGSVIGETAFAGTGFGQITYGNRSNNLTFGLGYAFDDTGWYQQPFVNLSFMIRTGDRFYLISENYIFSDDIDNFTILSIGGRRVFNKISLDFGLFTLASEVDIPFAIPWLSIILPIERRVSNK